jgi:hypothetical protein
MQLLVESFKPVVNDQMELSAILASIRNPLDDMTYRPAELSEARLLTTVV